MDNEQLIDNIIINNLKEHAKFFLDMNNELCNEDKIILKSILRVIQYYSLEDEYNTYFNNNKAAISRAIKSSIIRPYDIDVTHVEENSDGSVQIEVEAGDKARLALISEGVNFLLMKSAFECNTEDVTRWVKQGKESDHLLKSLAG